LFRDLGCHIDGFVAQTAHTIVLGANAETKKVTGKKADVVIAARNCFDAALRLVKEGNTNMQVTKAIEKISGVYKTNPLEGVLSHNVKKHMIDGDDVIINKETNEQKVVEHKFGKYEVYVIDVMVSTGEGKPREVKSLIKAFRLRLEQLFSREP
jgi:methionine aminopeptidase